jgi:aminopeptidase N
MNAACTGACAALCLASAAAAAPAHLELAITLNPGKRDLDAQAEIVTDATGAYGFFLAQGLEVQNAEADNQPLNVTKTGLGRNRRFEVGLPDGPRPLRLRIRYRGTLVGLDPTLSHRDTLAELPPMASNDGSFFPAGSGWYPQPGALFTWRMTVRTPEHQVAAAPGTPQKEEVRAGGRTAVFAFGQPAEGIDLMVGPYTVTERSARTAAGDVKVRAYFHAELAPLASGYLEAAARYLARYSEQIAPYPYSHFSIVSSPLPVGFGMPSLTYLGREVLRLPFIKDTSLGHEVLHNWWGNGVYVDVSRGNWSEGLTTFMADYAYKEDEGLEPARSMRHSWLRDYGSVSAADEQPLSAFRARYHTASSVIGYGKSAMLFYTLRERLGADGFRASLADFWERHRFGLASFDDLAAAFERHSDESLSGFFRQWLDQAGAPEIRVSEARNVGTPDSPRLAITLSQDFPDPSSRVPVRVFHAAGREDFVVMLSGSSVTTEHVTRAPATALAIDPDFTVWRRLRPEESPPILRDVVAARGVEVHALDVALKQAALECARGLAEGEVRAAATETGDPHAYRMIAGPARLVDAFLGERGALRPAEVSQGDTQVWVAAERAQRLLIVSLPVRIDDAKRTLAMLGKRLPHVSRYSWLTFEKDRTAGGGTWPADSPRIPVR